MERVNMKICIVGGGSAGFMTAATLLKVFPNYEISLIESPNESTVGVGESTILGFRSWLDLLGIKDDDFMRECNAIYKYSIKFTDFYKKGEAFHYPFGELKYPMNDWWYLKLQYPDLPYESYASMLYEHMAQIDTGHMYRSENFEKETAYHFDATLFAKWLKEKFCIPKGLKYFSEHIKDIEQNDEGIVSLNGKHKADLYIDCTGFKSMLLGETLKEPFESYEDLLPNNSAWATRIPYKDKEKELVPYTNCTAYNDGWIWNIPLWNRIGTGYVYSDKFIDDKDALSDFKTYLGRDDLEFKKIKMRVGIHERLFVKNVCAIGLSAGFIEPLESNGLYTVHQFLIKLIRNMTRGEISQWDKDNFTFACKYLFKNFADFVALHYALSHRKDTAYWKANFNKNWDEKLYKLAPTIEAGVVHTALMREQVHSFDCIGGHHAIATGMHWHPTDINMLKVRGVDMTEFKEENEKRLDDLTKRLKTWRDLAIDEGFSFMEFHENNVYY